MEINPLHQHRISVRLHNLRCAPRCGARNRAGLPCKAPAIRNRQRCRMHGGRSTGAPTGAANGNFRHGDWTGDAIKHRRWLRSLVAEVLMKEEEQ